MLAIFALIFNINRLRKDSRESLDKSDIDEMLKLAIIDIISWLIIVITITLLFIFDI